MLGGCGGNGSLVPIMVCLCLWQRSSTAGWNQAKSKGWATGHKLCTGYRVCVIVEDSSVLVCRVSAVSAYLVAAGLVLDHTPRPLETVSVCPQHPSKSPRGQGAKGNRSMGSQEFHTPCNRLCFQVSSLCSKTHPRRLGDAIHAGLPLARPDQAHVS